MKSVRFERSTEGKLKKIQNQVLKVGGPEAKGSAKGGYSSALALAKIHLPTVSEFTRIF